MKSILPIAGILAASIATASAASVVVDTVGTINPLGVAVLEASGADPASTSKLITSTAFASDVATAYANNTGGVWDFETDFAVEPTETITLNYGASLANSLVLTLGGTGINRDGSGDIRPSGSFQMGLAGNADPRTFTPSTPLLSVGIFNTDRNDAGRVPVLTVTFQDTTTATTSGANADNVYFHGFTTTSANPIVSFSLSQNAFVRYDDLGFVVVPEPSSALLLGLVGFGAILRRRR